VAVSVNQGDGSCGVSGFIADSALLTEEQLVAEYYAHCLALPFPALPCSALLCPARCPACRKLPHLLLSPQPCALLQAWVYWSKSQHAVCVSFRGTERDKWKVRVANAMPAGRAPEMLLYLTQRIRHTSLLCNMPACFPASSSCLLCWLPTCLLCAGHPDRPAPGGSTAGSRPSGRRPQAGRQAKAAKSWGTGMYSMLHA